MSPAQQTILFHLFLYHPRMHNMRKLRTRCLLAAIVVRLVGVDATLLRLLQRLVEELRLTIIDSACADRLV